jgi:hypothetical protein
MIPAENGLYCPRCCSAGDADRCPGYGKVDYELLGGGDRHCMRCGQT